MLGLTMTPPSRDDQIPKDFDDIPGDKVEQSEDKKGGVNDGLQTFVFSATLSKDLQRNFKKRFRPKGHKKHYKRDAAPASTLGMRTVFFNIIQLSLPVLLQLILRRFAPPPRFSRSRP
jgi:hypothetical protein